MPLPWIEIALIFASTTIATSILTKVGEDIYSFIKQRIKDRLTKTRDNVDVENYPTRATISINCNNALMQGRCVSSCYTVLLDALGKASEMIQDAELKQTNQLEVLKTERIYSEHEGIALQTPVFKEGLWFTYEYYSDQGMWKLKTVSLYKPDPEEGGYIAIAGEPDRTLSF